MHSQQFGLLTGATGYQNVTTLQIGYRMRSDKSHQGTNLPLPRLDFIHQGLISGFQVGVQEVAGNPCCTGT